MTESGLDKLFITEILNDLHRNANTRGCKAQEMLQDWAAELREKSRKDFPASRLKRTFIKEVGSAQW